MPSLTEAFAEVINGRPEPLNEDAQRVAKILQLWKDRKTDAAAKQLFEWTKTGVLNLAEFTQVIKQMADSDVISSLSKPEKPLTPKQIEKRNADWGNYREPGRDRAPTSGWN